MVDINFEADALLAELGIASDAGSSSAPARPPPPPAAGGAPPPPPPPPPAPKGPVKPAVAKDVQSEIDSVFDSVISFAGKKSTNKKKGPPPKVAPKPKRKIHVSSYTMQVKKKEPDSGVPAKPAAPKAPTGAPAPVQLPKAEPKKPSAPSATPAPPPPAPPAAPAPVESKEEAPVALVAFGPGLESFEVNCYGDFQVSCPHNISSDDLEVKVTGPSGTKPVEIDEHGNGQFSCSYLPTMAGDHKVEIKVNGVQIPGSPFTASVQFAAYTDKCRAEGPGLVSGTTSDPCRFKIIAKDGAGYARMRIHVVGPSKAEPIEMTENPADNSVDVVYHPSASGDYTIRVLWGDANVHGSPFTVPVSGETVNDPSKVTVTGDGLKGGNVNEPLKVFIEGEAGAGPGPLGVRMVGPSKPTIIADDSSEEGVELTITCLDPGDYQLILRWGQDEVPSSPYTVTVTGQGRESHPEKCTASGEGISTGKVGDAVSFRVNIPDDAGPGSLGVSVSGPHPPKPINIVNNEDGTMDVTYHPIAPGDYKIEVQWANQHISGSPFTASVSGQAVRNSKQVFAEGDILTAGEMKCNQLGTMTVTPKEGSGAGPLRAKMEGPAKADLQLSAGEGGCFLVSFIPKEHGSYRLHLLWGGEEDDCEINGSPFSIEVKKD